MIAPIRRYALILCAVSAPGVLAAASFPAAAATDAELYVSVNFKKTTLSGAITISTPTIGVVSTTGFPDVGFVTIESEIVKYTGKTSTSFTGCTRGADGTTAASHASGKIVTHAIIAAHHNVLKDEIEAIEDYFLEAGNEIHIDTTNARVGISTGSPQATLDVGGGVNIYGGLQLQGNGVYEVYSSTVTMYPSADSTPVETWGSHETVLYAGTNPYELPSGRWIDFYYNQTATFTYTPSVQTAHGIGLFVRNHGNIGNQGFQGAIEGNVLGVSTYATAAHVGLIAHTKWDNLGDASRIPGAPIIGFNSRIDVTDDTFGSSALAQGQMIHFRPDPYSLGGYPGRRYAFLNDVDRDMQFVTLGNIIHVSSAISVNGGDTVNISKQCLGTVILTSTAAITTAAQAFTTPSLTETNGTFNDGCIVTVVNGNLAAGRNITFRYSGSNFFTPSGADVVLPALGGAMQIASYPPYAVWFQTTPQTKYESAAVTIDNDGSGGSAATRTIYGGYPVVSVTCSDPDGCNVTLAETTSNGVAIHSGMLMRIINNGSNVVNFADTPGVSELAGAFAAGQYDSLSLVYDTTRWMETNRSNN